MDELRKVKRVVGKLDAEAPHEILLVLDGSTGQNALIQARRFNEAVGVTGVAITKLDGSAKGGSLVAVAKELKTPIRYIGIGEGLDDLDTFAAAPYVDALMEGAGTETP
jgi:fused signal recognition particle receptor